MTKDEMLQAIGSDWPFALECYKFVTGDPDAVIQSIAPVLPESDDEEKQTYQAAFMAVALCLGKACNWEVLNVNIDDISDVSQQFAVAMEMRNLVLMGFACFGEDDENGWPTIIIDQTRADKIRRYLGQKIYNIEFCR